MPSLHGFLADKHLTICFKAVVYECERSRCLLTLTKYKRWMMTALSPLILAILAGVSIVVQQALNANLRLVLNSAAWSGFMSYFVGIVCMALLALALHDPIPSLSVAARIPWWGWSGGVFCAIFIGSAIFLIPHLGAATFIALLVAGQMLASIIFDHFGFIGLAQRSVDFSRVTGIILLLGGVILIRR